jgi:hypothetical protein
VIRALSGAARRGHQPRASASRGDLTVNPGWFQGVAPLLEVLTDGIRAHLGRKPDTGDLLIALSAVSESLAARALSELGVDAAGLAEAVARMRSNGVVPAEDAIERTRQRKEVALEAEEFELARQLRE